MDIAFQGYMLLDTIKSNMDKNYEFKVDINKSFEEQELLEETKAIFANIFKDYWATPYQKESIVKNEESNIGDSSNLPIELKKEKFYEKIINFFQKIFHNLMN